MMRILSFVWFFGMVLSLSVSGLPPKDDGLKGTRKGAKGDSKKGKEDSEKHPRSSEKANKGKGEKESKKN